MPLAPIALFTYNRPDHTRRTIEALVQNDSAPESELFIFSDAPRNEAARAAVMEVREYIHSVQGFRSVVIYERPTNLGLAHSIISGVTELVNRYGSVIVLEDDLITSPFFLRYMNDSLDLYRDEEQVISIHGYVYPVREKLPETFFLRGSDCWGWGTWKRGWDLFEEDGSKLLHEIKSRHLTKDFDFGNSYHYTRMLEQQIQGKNDSWAVRWYASSYVHNKLTLYPGRSLLQNSGHDASGSNCPSTTHFVVSLSTSPIIPGDAIIEHNMQAYKAFSEYFRSLKLPFFKKLSISITKRWVKVSRRGKLIHRKAMQTEYGISHE